MKLLLEDDLKLERKKAANEAKMTPEALAARALKNQSANEKRKATKLRKKLALAAAGNGNGAAVAGNGNDEVVEDNDGDDDDDTNNDDDDVEESDDDVPVEENDNGNDVEDDDTSDLDIIEAAHFGKGLKQSKQNTNKYKKNIAVKLNKQKAKQVQAALNPRKITAAAPTVPSSASSNNLIRLSEANSKMERGGFLKLNVNIETTVPLGSFVILKVMCVFIKLIYIYISYF